MSEAHGNPSDNHGHAATPSLPEPHTPMWLPAVGALLFLSVGVIWGLMPAEKAPASPTVASASASGSAQPVTNGADAGAAPAPRH